MKPRWTRIVATACAVVAGVPAVWLGGSRLSTPEASPVVRHHPGLQRCSTERVLVEGDAVHPDHAEEDTGPDRAAAAVLLAAAECEAMEQIPFEHGMDALALAQHGVAWIAANEPDEVALDHLLEVWELAADQQRVGGYVNVGVWAAVQSTIYEALDDLLADPTTHLAQADRDAARDRLVALANRPLDTTEVHVREEHDLWRVLSLGLSDPWAWSWAWSYAWQVPRLVGQARSGEGPFFEEVTADVRTARMEAAVLAASLDLWGGCVERLETFAALDAPDLAVDLDFERRRCVVIGRSGDEIRIATTR